HPQRQDMTSAPTMAMINQAYDVLSDPQARAVYDLTRQTEPAEVQPVSSRRAQHLRRRGLRIVITAAQGGVIGLLILTLLGWSQLPGAAGLLEKLDWPVQSTPPGRWVWTLVLLGASIILLALRQLVTW